MRVRQSSGSTCVRLPTSAARRIPSGPGHPTGLPTLPEWAARRFSLTDRSRPPHGLLRPDMTIQCRMAMDEDQRSLGGPSTLIAPAGLAAKHVDGLRALCGRRQVAPFDPLVAYVRFAHVSRRNK